MNKTTRAHFQANPARFLEEAARTYVSSSPGNRLRAFSDTPIFEEPLVGFADGDLIVVISWGFVNPLLRSILWNK